MKHTPMIQQAGDNISTKLFNTIEDLITELDPTKVISIQRKVWMTRALTRNVVEKAAKFIKGQIEHGDHIEEAPLLVSIKEEQDDTFWYIEALENPLK